MTGVTGVTALERRGFQMSHFYFLGVTETFLNCDGLNQKNQDDENQTNL